MDVIINFSPALPCGTTDGLTTCGKPATVGIAYPKGNEFLVLPVCDDCVKASATLYKIIDLADELKAEKELGGNG